MSKILVIEDDRTIADQVADLLESHNYNVSVANDGLEADSMLRHYQYDLVILDWMLPGMNGFEVCKAYRNRSGKARILMLTARSSVSDKAAGLDCGADDYLSKPFDTVELMARVRALLRRPEAVKPAVLRCGGVELNTNSRSVKMGGSQIALSPAEFELLSFFMRNPNQVFSTESVLARVWKDTSDATDMSLRKCISRLRSHLFPEIIQTVHGIGYVLKMPSDEA